MRTALILGLAACASSPQVQQPDRTYAEHMAAADLHDQRAAQHDRGAETRSPASAVQYSCGDMVLNDQLTTGGERITTWMPCWNLIDESSITLADRERAAARRERANAAALVRAEVETCRSIPERERDHSPFAHRSSIAQVIAHREAGAVTGVRVIFKPVPGLTADYMRRSIACYQAHFAAFGGDPVDPTLVPNAEVTVLDPGGHVEVLVRAGSTVDGTIAFSRAQELLHPQTAGR